MHFQEEVKRDGILPENYYTTSNRETRVLLKGKKRRVENIRMDCAIIKRNGKLLCLEARKAKKGDKAVVGTAGIMEENNVLKDDTEFRFMSSNVSSEKNIVRTVRELAKELFKAKAAGKKIAFVAGPAVVHTGAGKTFSKLIASGYCNLLLAGNALAAHDLETAVYGTSLGCCSRTGKNIHHSHHLWAINKVNSAGGIRKAVENGIVKSGVMFECVKAGVPFILAGSIRDDGPLAEVVTDAVKAQDKMREALKGVEVVVMLSSMLHSIAVGNMLAAGVKTYCVDISLAAVVKICDRGTTQAKGIVADISLFLEALDSGLGALERDN